MGERGGMSAQEVHRVLDSLAAVRCSAWVAGGWGVDALVGRQTRAHRDLDLAIDADSETPALVALADIGYVVETDWRPVRVELVAPQRGWVDLHPVVFDDTGDGVQAGSDGTSFYYPKACFVTGMIGARVVRCLSVGQQLDFHTGYEPRVIDVADLELLGCLRADAGQKKNRAGRAPGGPGDRSSTRTGEC